jgi:8-oxo-dGTP pyrophosphatase MutT (NUDIX family)
MKNELLAPNGKPSNLNAMQYKLVRTPAFKKWFGDWENDPANSSKVVDANGEPMIVYHGTNNNFTKFSLEKVGSNVDYGMWGSGFYFSPLRSFSKYYGSKILKLFLNIRNPFVRNPNTQGSKSQFKPVYGKKESIELRNKILNSNYDGVLQFESGEKNVLTQIVSFEPNQIKLADGKNMTFDASSDDIRYEQGGGVFLNRSGENFWGNIGGGVLPVCTKTKRILVPLRSRYVNEPNQIGVWGGKADEEEGENELGIVNVVKREFKEETGYNGEIELIPAYIYQTPSKSFTYYNFIGLVEEEFTPLLDWETKNAKWITLEELVKYEDFIIIDFGYGTNKYYKHFGLMSLLNDKNSMDLLTNIRFAKGGKVKDGGDCYLVAGQLALEIKNEKIDYKGTPYLVHAEVKHSAIEGLRFGHAFIEDDENVYDFSNNREIILPKQLYYYFGDINPRDKKKYRKYTFEEAREKMLSTGNYGCWDIEVDFEKGGRVFNDKELLAKFKKGESIGFTGIAHLKSKGLIPRADGVKRISEKYMESGGRTISQTPAPKKDQIVGSDVNKKSSSKNLSSAKLIKFDAKTLNTIKNKVAKHNEENPNKKINLASAKAVVRRGMGAYSSSHRPTISNGLPNSRLAWGLARLNAFTYKIINGKSKSGKYKQDDDLIDELGFKVANYKNGGEMKKDIRCINCGWEWNKKDSELFDMYVCHKCGFDNTTFYTSIPVNNYSKGGETKTKSPNYLKMFLDL